MRSLIAVAALGIGLAGCATTEEKGLDASGNDVRYACDATRVHGLIGQTATQALGTEAVRGSGSRTMRWISPGMAVTMDYRTDRLNIHLDGQNRVTRIDCG